MGKPRPKYVAVKAFSVGRFRFAQGDAVTGERPLALGLKFGYVVDTSKRGGADESTDPETPTPDTPAEPPQENQS